VVGSLVIVLLQIFSWFWQWNHFENQLIVGKVKAYKIGAILGHPVYHATSRVVNYTKGRIPCQPPGRASFCSILKKTTSPRRLCLTVLQSCALLCEHWRRINTASLLRVISRTLDDHCMQSDDNAYSRWRGARRGCCCCCCWCVDTFISRCTSS